MRGWTLTTDCSIGVMLIFCIACYDMRRLWESSKFHMQLLARVELPRQLVRSVNTEFIQEGGAHSCKLFAPNYIYIYLFIYIYT